MVVVVLCGPAQTRYGNDQAQVAYVAGGHVHWASQDAHTRAGAVCGLDVCVGVLVGCAHGQQAAINRKTTIRL